jgi:hypothetical protein
MKPKTPIPIVKVDYTKKAWEQTATALHNRWHPDLPAVHTPSLSLRHARAVPAIRCLLRHAILVNMHFTPAIFTHA